ncbi:MAG: phage Gp37/Gp68 family protein, partial [candidate division WOR-3 bacterium]
IHEDELLIPQQWRKPRMAFLCSMADLFHEQVPTEFIRKVFRVMESCPQHTFQVLTKRTRRLRELAPKLPWPANVWMGVTVEDQHNTYRIADLLAVPARVRFLSCEPLLGAIPDLPLEGIHWVIVGGESGPGARVMKPDWVRSIRDRCERAGVPFYFKQWGGTCKAGNGRLLDGRVYDAMPPVLTLMTEPA